MKRLPKPPRLSDIATKEILQAMLLPATQEYVTRENAEYNHWEKLRHHPPPEGLTPEQGWYLVKMARAGQMRKLPLCSKDGRPFRFCLPVAAQEIVHEVDRWGGTSLAIIEKEASGLVSLKDRIVVNSLMEEAIATSQIEGAVTTRKVAKEMLRTNRQPRNRSERMILNSYQTINLLRQRLDRPLSLDFLLEIQESMTRDTLEETPTAAGRFRTADEEISIVDVRDNEVVFTPPHADLLPERLGRLIEFANAPAERENFIHPLAKAAILHFWLAYEHPFVDGNGRTAQALFYWFMLKSGYWLFEFLTISRTIVAAPAQYYRSFLHSEHDENDLTYSVIYQLQATQRALTDLRAYLTQKQAEQKAMANALRVFPGLNHRQRALLGDALKDPSRLYSFQSHQQENGISLLTARGDLLNLVSLGLLAEVKVGRRREFIAAPDLADKLGSGESRPKRRKK